MDASAPHSSRSVDNVFRDFKGRRAGIIKALTIDVEDFYRLCDPGKENLCLYGFPNEQWEVNLPAEEVPPEFPEPALGINFARDGMQEKDWIALVAVHSDSWLLSVAFYFGARFGFDQNERKRLFTVINELPTIFEVVTERKQAKTPAKNSVNGKPKSNSKLAPNSGPHRPAHSSKKKEEEEDEDMGAFDNDDNDVGDDDDEEEHGETLCGECGESDGADEFWICCDACERWFHGKCVKITPAKAEHIKQYKCPSCTSTKRARHPS
ncbi:PHD finger protein ALFIN-LIKE 3-like [Wolffia australiana]